MSTAKFDTLSNLAGTQTVPVATVAQGSAKAWVNFNGTGTVSIRAAFNVSSITDNGVGDYTVNFATAFSDANYAVVTGSQSPAATVHWLLVGNQISGGAIATDNQTASGFRVLGFAGAAFSDSAYNFISVLR